MRALIQRVRRCSVTITGSPTSDIGSGMLILLGVKADDREDDARWLAEKCSSLRIFDDSAGTMNVNIRDVGGEAMVVSQFTLYGDTTRGNRPSYTEAAPPDVAERLYEDFVRHLGRTLGADRVKTGVFRAMMDVELVNDGPVTILLETKARKS